MEDEEVSTNGTLVKMITSMNNQTTSTSTSLICTKCEPLYQTDVCLCNDDPYEAIQEVIVIFYTEIFMRKVVLWYFFTSEKIHNSTFRVKLSV